MQTGNVYMYTPTQGLIYVLVDDRALFDSIGADVAEHDPQPDGKRCLSKTVGKIGSQSTAVIFQHWLEA